MSQKPRPVPDPLRPEDSDRLPTPGARASSPEEQRLGETLLSEGLVTQAQLHEALREQEAGSGYVPLGQILVRRQLITRRQLDHLLSRRKTRLRLGEVLVRNDLITPDQLAIALEEQKRRRRPLGTVLVDMHLVSDEAMRQVLSLQLNIPFLDLDRLLIDRDLARLVNATYARRHGVVPVSLIGQNLTVVMDDPTNQSVVEELSASTGRIINVVTASREAIQRAFARVYSAEVARLEDVGDAADVITEEDNPAGLPKSKYLDDYRRDRMAAQIVRQVIRTASERGCSDVHLETLADGLRVRFRIDGVLQELHLGPLHEAMQENARRIVSRIKIMAKLDISERRRPQDGSFRVTLQQNGERHPVDLRVSVIPGYYGESVVIRLLDRRAVPVSIDALGFSAPVSEQLRQALARPTGILLVTGPTGSGKSSTLYAALMSLYRPQIRILTAEDPIEYVFEQFSQSEVNERIGNTFANYLRAFLRHDPEVIMVGEIRDHDTAGMAFRAAQTGHLVLSTLHTNTAIGAVTRLQDLSVDPNLIASSLLGVVSQRLVRTVCPSCRTPYTPSRDLVKEFFDTAPPMTWFRGRGCKACAFSGYKGRFAVAEFWSPDERDVILVSKGAPFEQIRESAARTTISMARDVASRLAEGRTNLEELIRVLPYSSVYEFRNLQMALFARAASA